MAHVQLVLLLAIGVAGCASEVEQVCDACRPRPPSTLFVVDRGGDAVLRYDGVTGQFDDVFAAGITQQIDRPSSVRLGPSGHIYLAGFGRGEVVRYDVASGSMMDVFYQDTTLLEEPVELAFRGDELLVLGNDTQNLVGIAPDGRTLRSFGYPEMRAAHDFVLGADERQVFVATDTHPQLGTAVQAWDVETGQLVHHFGTAGELATATGIALRDNGQLYVCDEQRNQVARFDPWTGAALATTVTGDSGLLDAPISLEFGPDGALYVLDANGIHRMDPDTGVELSLLVSREDGRIAAARSFTFLTEVAIAAAVARTR